jgi:hypothetical protein
MVVRMSGARCMRLDPASGQSVRAACMGRQPGIQAATHALFACAWACVRSGLSSWHVSIWRMHAHVRGTLHAMHCLDAEDSASAIVQQHMGSQASKQAWVGVRPEGMSSSRLQDLTRA